MSIPQKVRKVSDLFLLEIHIYIDIEKSSEKRKRNWRTGYRRTYYVRLGDKANITLRTIVT